MTAAGVVTGPLIMWAVLFGAGWIILWASGRMSAVARILWAAPTAAAVLASVGLVQVFVSFEFGPPAALAAVVVAALGSGSLRWWGRHNLPPMRDETSADAGPRLVLVAVTASIGLSAAVLGAATGWDLGVVSQTWDAIFDANATRHAFESGVIAPNHIAEFGYFQLYRSWYPSFFHTLGSLAMSLLGVDAVVATNVAAIVIAGSLWPCLAAAAVRFALGASPATTLGGMAMAWGFAGMPWIPLGWGVLWATATAGTTVAFMVLGWAGCLGLLPARHTRRRNVLVMLAGAFATAVLHPRIAVLGGVLWIALWAIHFGLRAVADLRRGARGPAARGLGLALLPLLPMVPFLLWFGRGEAAMTSRLWPVERGLVAELTGYLVNGPMGTAPLVVSGALALWGAYLAWRGDLRWLVLLLLVAVGLDVITAVAQQWRAWAGLARFWYSDRHRTIVVPPFMLVALACVALLHVIRLGGRMPRWIPPRAIALIAGLATVGMGALGGAAYLREFYAGAAADPVRSLVSDRDRAFYREVAKIVPATARILNNANDGSALLYAYEGRKPVFLLAGIRSSTYHGEALREFFVTYTSADTCALARADGVEWVINGGQPYASLEVDRFSAPGMQIPPGFWATTPVLRDGELALYRITGCVGR